MNQSTKDFIWFVCGVFLFKIFGAEPWQAVAIVAILSVLIDIKNIIQKHESIK